MTFGLIEVDRTGDVATLTLARPRRMNALTPALFAELTDALAGEIAAGARAAVLTGAGAAFCAGADLAGTGDDALTDDLGDLLERVYNPFVRLVADLPIPLVTAVNGPAVGAGASLALLGDIAVMARSAYLMLAFVGIGLVPDAGATWLVAQAAGRARALEMALLGERMSADEALAAGLVARVADDADCLPAAQAIAARLAAGPAVAIGMIRRQVAAALTGPLSEILDLERDHQRRAGHTRDFGEAVEAFAAKRPPVFRGE